MTDRVKGLIVSLDTDIRVDDVEPLVNAIRCLQHVAGVEVSVTDSSDMLARMRVDTEWRGKILKLLQGE